MDIRTLRYFVEVVRQQSFTRAAEKLFVTQPTISKMLKNLEDELNCTLLLRDGRKLLLTDTGRVVFERGLAILAEFRQLEAELADINHLTKGLLRLGIRRVGGKRKCGGKRRQDPLHDAFTSCSTALLRRSNSPFARQTYTPVSKKEITITPMPIGMPRVTLVPACSGVPSQCGAKAISIIKPT